MVVADIRYPFPGSVLNGKTQTQQQQQQKRESIFYHTQLVMIIMLMMVRGLFLVSAVVVDVK